MGTITLLPGGNTPDPVSPPPLQTPRLLICENCGAEDEFPAIRLAYVEPPIAVKNIVFLCAACLVLLNARRLTDADYAAIAKISPARLGGEFSPLRSSGGG